jgi:recombinational DNA repair protein (RecF pathway)
LCEITAATVRDGQPEADTFRLLGALLSAMENGLHPWLAVRYAEYWTVKLHGVLPDLAHCAGCGEPFAGPDLRYAADSGVFCKRCDKPQGAVALTGDDVALLAAFDKTPPSALLVSPERAKPGGALEALLRGSLETFAEHRFRTYRHLRAATAGPGAGA